MLISTCFLYICIVQKDKPTAVVGLHYLKKPFSKHRPARPMLSISRFVHMCVCLCADMQFVTNFTRIKYQNNFLPQKCVNYDKLRFPTKQRKLYFHIINIHTQGFSVKHRMFRAKFSPPKFFTWIISVHQRQIACLQLCCQFKFL